MVIEGWGLFWMLISLVLVIEGLMPAISPVRWRQWLLRMTEVQDTTVRAFGLGSMCLGAVIMAIVHQMSRV